MKSDGMNAKASFRETPNRPATGRRCVPTDALGGALGKGVCELAPGRGGSSLPTSGPGCGIIPLLVALGSPEEEDGGHGCPFPLPFTAQGGAGVKPSGGTAPEPGTESSSGGTGWGWGGLRRLRPYCKGTFPVGNMERLLCRDLRTAERPPPRAIPGAGAPPPHPPSGGTLGHLQGWPGAPETLPAQGGPWALSEAPPGGRQGFGPPPRSPMGRTCSCGLFAELHTHSGAADAHSGAP